MGQRSAAAGLGYYASVVSGSLSTKTTLETSRLASASAKMRRRCSPAASASSVMLPLWSLPTTAPWLPTCMTPWWMQRSPAGSSSDQTSTRTVQAPSGPQSGRVATAKPGEGELPGSVSDSAPKTTCSCQVSHCGWSRQVASTRATCAQWGDTSSWRSTVTTKRYFALRCALGAEGGQQ